MQRGTPKSTSSWLFKKLHYGSASLQYAESPLMLLGTAAAEAIQFGNQAFQAGSAVHGAASSWLNVSNGFLSLLDGMGIAEGSLTAASGLSTMWLAYNLDDSELQGTDKGKIRKTLFRKGLRETAKGGTLTTLSALHMPALGYAIATTMDLVEILAKHYYSLQNEDNKWTWWANTEVLMKLTEAAGWWSLVAFSLVAANPAFLAAGAVCLAAAGIYKTFGKNQAMPTLVKDARGMSCKKGEDSVEDDTIAYGDGGGGVQASPPSTTTAQAESSTNRRRDHNTREADDRLLSTASDESPPPSPSNKKTTLSDNEQDWDYNSSGNRAQLSFASSDQRTEPFEFRFRK